MSGVLCLSGGVGGAKLALGLANLLAPGELGILTNVGDDFRHMGLHVSPDLDTVMYTLAGIANRDLGWGIENESWAFMAAVERLGGETWFRLGDRDLATHVRRTERLAAGHRLTEITAELTARLGIRQAILPATDDSLQTIVVTPDGPLPFQHYFVRERCGPRVLRIEFAGADQARPSPALAEWLERGLDAILIAPSNPYLSIDPILAIPGLREMIRRAGVPVVAVSPLIGGKAVKGPTAKIMAELGIAQDCHSVAKHYQGLIDGLMIDAADGHESEAITALGIRARPANILMKTDLEKTILAGEALDFAMSLRNSR